MEKLDWKTLHELKALLIYKRLNESESKRVERELSKDNIFSKDKTLSVKNKINNIRYLDTEGKRGLAHVSKKTRETWEKHKNTSIRELEKIIKERVTRILNNHKDFR